MGTNLASSSTTCSQSERYQLSIANPKALHSDEQTRTPAILDRFLHLPKHSSASPFTKRKCNADEDHSTVKRKKVQAPQSSNDTQERRETRKRKQETVLAKEPVESTPKRYKSLHPTPPLTQNNLRLLEETMSNATGKRSYASTRQSSRSSQTTKSFRAYSASDVRFENALRDFFVDFQEAEEACSSDVARVLKILDKERDSPEPDLGASKAFHDIRRLVTTENEAAVTSRLTPLLMPHRDLPHNDFKTRNLLYRHDTAWYNWRSLHPGELPVQKPDFCITFKASAFTIAQQRQLGSPYLDKAGIFPVVLLEVKTAMQGSQVADRQNANNAVPVLIRDFILQQRLGRDLELQQKIRLLTVAHDTRSMWIKGWFYVLQQGGKPKWKSQLIKHVPFTLSTDKGFETARKCMLNLMEHVSDEGLRQLLADSAKALEGKLGNIVFDPREWSVSQTEPVHAHEQSRKSVESHAVNLESTNDAGDPHSDDVIPKRSKR